MDNCPFCKEPITDDHFGTIGNSVRLDCNPDAYIMRPTHTLLYGVDDAGDYWQVCAFDEDGNLNVQVFQIGNAGFFRDFLAEKVRWHRKRANHLEYVLRKKISGV